VASDAARKRTKNFPLPFDEKKQVRSSPGPFTSFDFSDVAGGSGAVLVSGITTVDVGYQLSVRELKDLADGARNTAERAKRPKRNA